MTATRNWPVISSYSSLIRILMCYHFILLSSPSSSSPPEESAQEHNYYQPTRDESMIEALPVPHKDEEQQLQEVNDDSAIRDPSRSPSPTIEGISLDVASNTAITPRRTDVLFGTKYKYHPGTLELQKVVTKRLPVFESIVLRTEKTKFVDSLVEHLRASGIRFLERREETNSWIEVDHHVARKKVAKNFRNKRRTTGLGASLWGSTAKVPNQHILDKK